MRRHVSLDNVVSNTGVEGTLTMITSMDNLCVSNFVIVQRRCATRGDLLGWWQNFESISYSQQLSIWING